MKKTKKALASLAIAGMTISMVPFNAFATGTVPTRVAGTTAEQTAVQIADQTGYTGTAILASSASYGAADALTAGPLAAYLKAPILLQGPGAVLNADTKAELTKLNVKTVYVTSGTAVISQAVIDQIKGLGIAVESLGGNDRFETSVNIAKKLVALGAPVKKVAVAYGWLNQDALSIAAVASAANEPIILTEKAGLSASAKAFLAANLGITAADVIGGTGVIDASVLAQLPSPTRHYGNTAYDTNNQVIQDFASSLTFDNVFVASGVTGIDALAGAPLAAKTKSAIVLTDGVNVPSVATFTYSKSSASTVVTALGGTAVVPENVRVGIAEGKVTTAPGELGITSISALNDTNQFLKIEFNKVVSGIQASDIVIKDAKKGDNYGVKAVTLAADGKSVTAELYQAKEDENVLQENTEYTVTVTANGQTLKSTFYDSAFIEGRVVDINVGDDEFVVVDDDDATKITVTVTKDVKFDYEAAMGELVRVWYNDDQDLLKYEIVDKSSITDAIEITDVDEIKLLTADKKYDTSDEEYDEDDSTKFAFYVDGERVDEDGEIPTEYVDQKFNFAKVGLDKSGDVEFVSAYALNDFLIVDSVDEDEIVGIDGDGTSGSFDAGDTTVVKDGKVVALADLKKGDVLFYSEKADDDDGFAEVPNKTVTGEIDEVYADSIEVDGDTYKFIADEDVINDFGDLAYGTAVYLNEDGETEAVDSDIAEELQAAGKVTLYLDRAGNLAYISGDTAEVDSNTLTAILTDKIETDSSYSKQSVQVEALLENGDEELYDITLEDLDTITINGEDYDIDNEDTDATNSDYVVEVDETTNELSLYDSVDGDQVDGTTVDLNEMEGHVVKVDLTDDGDVKELEFFEANDTDEGTDVLTNGDLEAGDDYFDGNGAGAKQLKDSTVVYDATSISGTDYEADDITITTWGKYDGSDIDNARIIYNDDNEVEALVIIETSSSSDVYEEAVITKVLRNTDDEIVSITAYINGELVTVEADDITGFDDSSDLQKGDVAILEFDENNLKLVQGIQAASKTGTEYNARVLTGKTVTSVDVGSKEVVIGGITYKLSSDGEVLDASDLNDISVEGLADLREEKNVTVVLDENTGKFVKYFIYGLDVVADTTAPTATVTTASVNIGTNVTTVKSTEAGTAYLVLDSANLNTVTALNAAVTAGTAKKATVTANTATSISTTGLAAGTYKVVAVDVAGNVSAESTGTITLTPVVTVNPFTVAPKFVLVEIDGTLDLTKAKSVKATGNAGTVSGTVNATTGAFVIETATFSTEYVKVQAYDAQGIAVGNPVSVLVM